MHAAGTGTSAGGSATKALAFYLPQYHPIPENDQWWGKGFTEWHNVVKARPLFPGHYQPHAPGELGYYDLRVPEVRAAQAELARTHGISGFVYYHYWFHGRRLLDRPFREVLESGEPDFPFALCWANEEWTRGWDAQTGHILVRQEYSPEDDLAHIRWLLDAFADPRYITIDGRPLLLIYRPALMPDVARTSELWRKEAQRAGFPDLYLCWVESWGPPPGGQGPAAFGLDASVGFMPLSGEQLHAPLETLRGHRLLDYASAAQAEVDKLHHRWKRFPSVMVGWDNTARRARAATVYSGATPERYEAWLRATAEFVADVPAEENYLFILAWNEWAEGNHLEPDQRHGRAFLEATRAVLLDAPPDGGAVAGKGATGTTAPALTEGPGGSLPWEEASETITSAAIGLLSQLGPGDVVVDLGLVPNRTAASVLERRGVELVHRPLTDPAALKAELDTFDRVDALLLLDALEHLAEPHLLLSALSSWAGEHGDPTLVVTVPHVAHLDVGLRLLCGRFDVKEAGPLAASSLRYFTEETLDRLVTRSGWNVEARDDVHSLHSDQYAVGLRDGLPEEMVGALQATAQAVNANWSVVEFVWALCPNPAVPAPDTYLQAVGAAGGREEPGIDPEATAAIADYLASVGLVASEVNRRAVKAYRQGALAAVAAASGTPSLSYWKQVMLRYAYSSRRRAAVFTRAHRLLRRAR